MTSLEESRPYAEPSLDIATHNSIFDHVDLLIRYRCLRDQRSAQFMALTRRNKKICLFRQPGIVSSHSTPAKRRSSNLPQSALRQRVTVLPFLVHAANGWAVRSSGIVTLNFTGRREHSFDSAFPQFFGWLLQSGHVLAGELYQGGGSRKF